MSSEDLFTTGNVQEVLPGALCPLTYAVLTKTLERGIHEQIAGKAEEGEEPYIQYFPTFRHHVFMDVMNVFFKSTDKEVGIDKKISAIAVLGYDFNTPETHR